MEVLWEDHECHLQRSPQPHAAGAASSQHQPCPQTRGRGCCSAPRHSGLARGFYCCGSPRHKVLGACREPNLNSLRECSRAGSPGHIISLCFLFLPRGTFPSGPGVKQRGRRGRRRCAVPGVSEFSLSLGWLGSSSPQLDACAHAVAIRHRKAVASQPSLCRIWRWHPTDLDVREQIIGTATATSASPPKPLRFHFPRHDCCSIRASSTEPPVPRAGHGALT